MYLFFDTETTGLPRDWRAPLSDLDNWPRLVQLAWLRTDADGRELAAASEIIRPDGFTIPDAAAAVHGITTERALSEGAALRPVLADFVRAVEEAQVLVAHNIAFDEMIMGAELLRHEFDHEMSARPKVCTMTSATDYCALEKSSGYGYKWPKLLELHYCLFNEGFTGAHDALADVRACVRCFFELMRRGVITTD